MIEIRFKDWQNKDYVSVAKFEDPADAKQHMVDCVEKGTCEVECVETGEIIEKKEQEFLMAVLWDTEGKLCGQL